MLSSKVHGFTVGESLKFNVQSLMFKVCEMKILFAFLAVISLQFVHAQDINTLMKEASDLEKQVNESAALEKYKQIVSLDAKNVTALTKCAEFNCNIGAREKDKSTKLNFYNTAKNYAQQAIDADANNADANYVMAFSIMKMAEVETDNKRIAPLIHDTKTYIDKSLHANPAFAKTNNILGKWHYEMLHSSWIKKPGVKAFYDVLQEAEIDSAILYFEKCRRFDQYYVRNYLDLAYAYHFDNQPAKAIETLNMMAKLPNRTVDDAALKQQGKLLWDQLQ